MQWAILGPVKAIVGISSVSLVLAQVSPVVSTSTGIDALGRLSLDGCLMAAVIALWRALSRKDEQVVTMASKVTETMALVTTAITELRSTIKDLKLEYEDLPCALRDRKQ